MKNPEWKGSPNFTPGRKGYSIEAVVIHVMGGYLYGCDEWFNNRPTYSGVSAHYGIGGADKREIHQYVKLEDTAWHAGGNAKGTWNFLGLDDSDANPYTIGIELEGGYSGEAIDPSTIDEASWLVATLYKDGWLKGIGRDRVIGHNEINQVSRTMCPGIDMNKFVKMVQEKYNTLVLPVDDNLYRIISVSGKQLNAYKVKDNAFNFWVQDKTNKVMYNGSDITLEFINMSNTLEKENAELKTEIANKESTITQKSNEISDLKIKVDTLQREVGTLKVTIKNLKEQSDQEFNLFSVIYEQIKKYLGRSK